MSGQRRQDVGHPDLDPALATDPMIDPATGQAAGRATARRRWSWVDALVTLAGAALTAIGVVRLVRTGVNETWFQPVEEVLEADGTALLGALETGAGVLLMLAGLARSRALTGLIGLALAGAGVLAVVENSDVNRELAIQKWWAWVLAAAGAVIALLSLLPRGRSVEGRSRPGGGSSRPYRRARPTPGMGISG